MLVTMLDVFDTKPVQIVRILAHEAYHVTCRVLQAMGEDKPGEETVAYMTGDIAAQLFEDYSRSRSPLARKRRRRKQGFTAS